MDTTLVSNIVAAIVFAVIGIVTFVVAFVVIDKMTPFTLWKEIIDEHNTALAIVVSAVALSCAIIVSSAIR